jgi:predicted dehydrogenase
MGGWEWLMDRAVPRIALVGLGNWGKNYLRNLASLGALAAVCDKNEAALANAQRDFPQVQTCTSVDELAALETVDAAVVAVPTPFHHGVAKTLLSAGKHCRWKNRCATALLAPSSYASWRRRSTSRS